MSGEISLDELLSEVARLDAKPRTRPPFTDIQIAAIGAARDRGVEWSVIARWFNEKFGTSFVGPKLCNKYHHQINVG